MKSDMMQQCCGKDGMPNFEMMKDFMEQQGKKVFSEDDLTRMKKFCTQMDKSDTDCEKKMKQMMVLCGCKCH